MPLAPYLALETIVRPGAFARESESLRPAIQKLEESGGWLPVLNEDGLLVGVLRESALRRALVEDLDWNSPVRDLVDERVASLPVSATVAEAFRLMQSMNEDRVAVVDMAGYYLGTLSIADVVRPEPPMPKPLMIGGMATPLGVYLTGGGVRAGAPPIGLVFTGAAMVLALVLTGKVAGEIAFQSFRAGLSLPAAIQLESFLTLVFFFGTLRLMPLSGTHAAEHQVVHAIERDEPLERDVVRRMPRVHPRCGTNFGVGMMLFLWLGTTPLIQSEELRLLSAALATLAFWRPLGAFAQLYLTTKPANDAQLDDGIAAGKELLIKYAKSGRRHLTLRDRILGSGLLHVMGGGWAMALFLYVIGRLTGVSLVE